ncbi:MAG: hypothetical protein ABI678_12415 [Kofleriaceae bacterium]
MTRALLLLALASCATDDPCDAVTGTCVTVHIESPTVASIDQLELDLSWGDHHATTTVQAEGTASLPLVTAIAVDGEAPRLAVVAAGKLRVLVLGTGANAATLADHVELHLVLVKPGTCTAGAHYCGGDKLAGMADTLYECNAGGVPLARGVCAGGCTTMPADDDACAPVGGACQESSLYCGGDKLAGDPRTLYRCSGGVGVAVMTCATACDVNPGANDSCR